MVSSITPFVSFAHTIDAENPYKGLEDTDLRHFLQERRAIPRLATIITGGFCAPNDTNPWTRFLVRGLYDPRLFLFIFDFVLNFEEGRKRGRFEE